MIELSRYFSTHQIVVNADMNKLQMPSWKLDSRIQHKPIAINTMNYYDVMVDQLYFGAWKRVPNLDPLLPMVNVFIHPLLDQLLNCTSPVQKHFQNYPSNIATYEYIWYYWLLNWCYSSKRVCPIERIGLIRPDFIGNYIIYITNNYQSPNENSFYNNRQKSDMKWFQSGKSGQIPTLLERQIPEKMH